MIESKGPVLLDIADGITRLRLNRPDAANGMSAELPSALCDAIMVCHGRPDLRVLLLSRRGDEFLRGRRRSCVCVEEARSCPTTSGRRRRICRTR